MNNKKNLSFPLSPEGILNFGYKKWCESKYSKVKISNGYAESQDRIINLFKKEFVDSKDNFLRNTAICNYSLMICLARYFHYTNFLEKLNKKNFNNVYYHGNKKIKNFDFEDIIFKKYFENSFLNLKKNNHLNFYKNILKNLFFFISKKKKLLLFSTNNYIENIFSRKEYLYFYEELNDKNLNILVNDHVYLKIENKIDKIFNTFSKRVTKKKERILKKKIISNFYQTYYFLKESKVSNYNFNFIPNNLSNSINRAYTLRRMLDKKQVETFMHGNIFPNYNLVEKEQIFLTGLSLGGKINVSSNFEKKFLEKTYSHNKNLFATKPIIKINKQLKIPFVKCQTKTDRVLIIGFPMTLDLYRSHAHTTQFSMLKHEIKIIQNCKKHNIEIDYKIHPDRVNELKNLYKSLQINIVYPNLEKILHKYSTVICPHPHTTTFGQILLSDAKIIAFNDKRLKWNNEILRNLKKRTEIINTWETKNDELFFDEKDLAIAFKKLDNIKYVKNKYKGFKNLIS